jgi:Phage capsid family
MAAILKTDVFNPETLTEAVQGVLAQKTAFMGSRLASLGVVLVSGSMPVGGPKAIGTTITVPYWGTLGEFASNAEGSSVTPSKTGQVTETCTVARDSLAFEVSRWAEGNAFVNPNVGDPYEEAARQIAVAATRAMDRRCITAASASGVYVKDVYSATTPVNLTWDLCVDAKFEGWGDEQDNIAALIVHSHAHKDLLKLKDTTGRPLLLQSQTEGGPVDTFCGVPVVVSDRVPVTGSTMGAVTSSGTSPPVATLAGTPLGPWKLHIDCTVGGATTASVRFSTDGGNIWSADITVADDGVPVALTDTAVDSRVGVNGATGVTVAFASGTFNADNLWTANASLKCMSMLCKQRSLAFWYSAAHMGLETDKDIMKHTDLAAMHLYGAAHRYRRMAEGTKPGIIQLVHNVSGFA